MKAMLAYKDIASCFKRDRRVVAAYVFGSMVRGTTNAESDLDIAVLLDKKIDRDDLSDVALELTCRIVKLTGNDRIDILILNSAGPILRHQVYLRGRLIFCRDAKTAMRFKDLSSSEYLDFLPTRKLAEEKMLGRISRGGRNG